MKIVHLKPRSLAVETILLIMCELVAMKIRKFFILDYHYRNSIKMVKLNQVKLEVEELKMLWNDEDFSTRAINNRK